MGVYTGVQNDVFSVFASVDWLAENIKVYPTNTIPIAPGTEYLRVTILPQGDSLNINSVSGLLMVDIFAKFGNGPKRVNELADKLDSYLRGNQLATNSGAVTQFQYSSLKDVGKDVDNAALYRAIYQIPFNYFGVN